jgi:predicted nucleic acid-binding protein
MILDASVAVKLAAYEKDTEQALALMTAPAAAPAYVMIETANALWAKARRGQIETADIRRCYAKLQTMPVRLVPDSQLVDAALDLAIALNYPLYDCLYLALAMLEDDFVVTADKRFFDAAQNNVLTKDRVQLFG